MLTIERIYAVTDNIDSAGKQAIAYLTLKHEARERALPKSRTAIRFCANSIRATHRQEFHASEKLIEQAGALLQEMSNDLQGHRDIFFAGFVQDAQKEYAEAITFSTLTRHRPLPTADELSIGWPAYLNGLAECVGELRRYVLDQLRHGQFEACEIYLGYMDDIYAVLTSVDFPDAITSGLRRATDSTRGILEKTRGDLTAAIGQAQLQQSMHALQAALQHNSLLSNTSENTKK
jgi:translin